MRRSTPERRPPMGSERELGRWAADAARRPCLWTPGIPGLRSCSFLRRSAPANAARTRGLHRLLRWRAGPDGRGKFVTRQGLDVGYLGERPVEGFTSATVRPVLKRFEGFQRRDLLCHGGGDELVDGDAFLPGQLADRIVEGLWESKTERVHGSAPMLERNSPGLPTLGPK